MYEMKTIYAITHISGGANGRGGGGGGANRKYSRILVAQFLEKRYEKA